MVSDSKDDAEMTQESIESIFGIDAGIVCNALNKNDMMTINDLMKATALQPEEIYVALGWFGRENKISVGHKGRSGPFHCGLMVSQRPPHEYASNLACATGSYPISMSGASGNPRRCASSLIAQPAMNSNLPHINVPQFILYFS